MRVVYLTGLVYNEVRRFVEQKEGIRYVYVIIN